MSQTQEYFKAVIESQAQAMESLMTNQPTANPQLMDEAKQLLEEAVLKATQASREVTDGISS
ncbi:hypothetical protein OTK51_19130 [Vibrio scophthalmi]|uniref:hypothetical protein n=1 Tax=Vibrio scophthalmi TaxID=45658 RepID=UPI0022850772|nr:hypothetical protein [Vibrio scophthalmi]MCY9805541.1 hypothetical protein [Vibrio scophthalmi]